jgi:hypothetical protein
MNEIEFVKQVGLLTPTRDELRIKNYPQDLISYLIEGFKITPRSNVSAPNEIESLLKSYDLSSFKANDISFDVTLEEDEDFIFFGWDANDRLAIEKSTNKIVAYDSYSDRIVFYCADDSSKFLDAIIEVLTFAREKMLNLYEDMERDKRASQIAYIAALKAGGEKYEDYFKAVLWVEGP